MEDVNFDTRPKQPARICQLPPEITQHIFSFLACRHLMSLSRTCKGLKRHAEDDRLWLRLIKQHLPAEDVPETGSPCRTFRELYLGHYPYWFLPEHRLWMSDQAYDGKLMLVKFDVHTACIEGYPIESLPGQSDFTPWELDPGIPIHNFAPTIKADWLSHEFQLPPHSPSESPFCTKEGLWDGELRIGQHDCPSDYHVRRSFFLGRDIPQQHVSSSMELWPPQTIPNMPRVRNASRDLFRGRGHKPQRYEDISQTTCRIRRWNQFNQRSLGILKHFGVRLREDVQTWSAIDPRLYTPTPDKPYQGLFIGDYAGHGREHLLVLQIDEAPSLPASTESSAYFGSDIDALEAEFGHDSSHVHATGRQENVPPNVQNEQAHKGAMVAIKLTGDPNIPRGQYTFVADDIGDQGLVRIAHEKPFRGARVVKSRGHVAESGFQNDEYIPTQLFLINPNRFAQFWMPFRHISYYNRIRPELLHRRDQTPGPANRHAQLMQA